MASRLELDAKLRELLGSNNVYYQPPESMNYPAIKYSVAGIDSKKANNANYLSTKRYQVTVMSRLPDHPVIEKLLALPMCSFDRHYTADNLNHDVFTLYY